MTDDDLRDLLTDAVADVEPAYRLDAIRARTSRPRRRRSWYAAGGAILAAAAVVTAVSVVSDDRPRREPPASNGDHAVALYFVGDTPAGPRLYREFQRVSGGPLAALEAITTARGPEDPDYRTVWPAGIFDSVKVVDDAIEVEIGPWSGPLIHVTEPQVALYLQQVVYTVQAATGEDSLPVMFEGSPISGFVLPGTTYLASAGEDRAPQLETLSLMSISDPSEGLRVQGSFVARGRASSFEGTVRWEIRRGPKMVLDGFTTADGWVDHLYPWETEPIDVSQLEPGRYTFVAMTDDPSGGEGRGPFTDTRTIIVD